VKDKLEIRDAEVAKVLIDVTQTRLLEPFFNEDITLSEAAKKLEIKMTTLLYHVTKFIGLGLLTVSKEEARKGKAVKYYRTTAKVFSVPFDITPNHSLSHLLGQINQPEQVIFMRETARALQNMTSQWKLDISQGLTMTMSRMDKTLPNNISVGRNDPAVMSTAGGLNLDFNTAKTLEKEMRELIKSYMNKQNPKEQLYYYRIGLTPVQDESLGSED
jgi:hypothetical protein